MALPITKLRPLHPEDGGGGGGVKGLFMFLPLCNWPLMLLKALQAATSESCLKSDFRIVLLLAFKPHFLITGQAPATPSGPICSAPASAWRVKTGTLLITSSACYILKTIPKGTILSAIDPRGLI